MMNFNALPGGNTRLFDSPVGACIRNIAVTGELSMKRARVFTEPDSAAASTTERRARARDLARAAKLKMHAGTVVHETINRWNIRASPGVDQS